MVERALVTFAGWFLGIGAMLIHNHSFTCRGNTDVWVSMDESLMNFELKTTMLLPLVRYENH